MTTISENHVVIHDTTGKYKAGTILSDKIARMASREKLKMLPVHPEFLSSSGVSGYSYRLWGDGVELATTIPTYHAPITLMIEPGYMKLNYIIALSQSKDQTSSISEGSLRLVVARNLRNTVNLSVSHQSSPHVRCEWEQSPVVYLEGQARIDASDSGFLNLAIYGSLPGACVLWVAVSQSA